MITAYQSAKIKAVNQLLAAREALITLPSNICLDTASSQKIHTLVNQLDSLIDKLVTNEKPK